MDCPYFPNHDSRPNLTTRRPGKAFVASFLLLGCFSFSGCKLFDAVKSEAKVQPEIVFHVAPELQAASIQVDVLGAKQIEYELWVKKSVDAYLSPGDKHRERMPKHTFTFQYGDSESKALTLQDDIWSHWLERDASYLVVIADLPGYYEDALGNEDKRRVILPLDAVQWSKGQGDTISVYLTPDGLISDPAPQYAHPSFLVPAYQ